VSFPTIVATIFRSRSTSQRAKNFQDELIDRVQALGGVESAALSRMTPFSYRNYSTAPIAVDGYAAPPDQQPTADYNEVGLGFLSTMGIPLVSGREFTRADNETAPLVAMVDETMAAQFWRGVDPVGRGGGLVLGLVAALQVTRLLGYLLYNVSPRDPIAFGSAFAVITVASLVACFVPAWRATRTDPLRALRG
jgi:hypothetical protein